MCLQGTWNPIPVKGVLAVEHLLSLSALPEERCASPLGIQLSLSFPEAEANSWRFGFNFYQLTFCIYIYIHISISISIYIYISLYACVHLVQKISPLPLFILTYGISNPEILHVNTVNCNHTTGIWIARLQLFWKEMVKLWFTREPCSSQDSGLKDTLETCSQDWYKHINGWMC